MRKHYHIQNGVKPTYKPRAIFWALLFISITTFSYFQIPKNEFSKPQNSGLISESKAQVSAIAPTKLEHATLTAPIPWPAFGTSAYGVHKDNLVATSDEEPKKVPIASLAKIITVLAILEEKPLEIGEKGPTISLNDHDVELVNEYARKSGVYLPVYSGEEITQYEAIQAILLVSANNISDTLANWAFGSIEEYVDYANNMLAELGLGDTIVADASGFSPQTVSTAEDMVDLGYIYMQHPVLREIALQQSARLSFVGLIKNHNSFANSDNFIGLKVGNTDEAGKTYIAANIRPAKEGFQEEISVAVVLGAEDFYSAARDAKQIIAAGDKGHDEIPKVP